LDSNIYTIKSFQSLEKEELKKVAISNKIITDNLPIINKSPKAVSYLKIRSRLVKSYEVVNSVIQHVDSEFVKEKTDIFKQFNSRNLVEKILKSDKGVVLLDKDLFELSDFIKKSPFKLESTLDDIIPLKRTVTTIKGKEEDWYYLFMHKPTAISYMQLERIKLLITKTQLLYQEAALAEIGYMPTYFSQFNPKLYVLKASVKEYKEEDMIKPGQKVVNITDEVYDDLFKKILNSLHTENIFVGLNNTLLKDFDFMMGKDFDVDISPKVNLVKGDKNYKVIFNKTGEYLLRFYDTRNMNKKILFEKRIMVNPIPDPVVRVKGDNLSSYTISVKDLLASERLEAKLEINNLNFFPGRINSFKVIRIHNGKEEESVSNYGELFQSPTQKVLGALKKNDMLIFDNVNISLIDGSTRTSAPIIYKIID
jgi:hypothetical protein